MTTWVDFKAVRNAVSLEAVVTTMYRLPNLRREGDRLVGPCPIHRGDNPRAWQADLQKNLWHCFSKCQGGGNQLDFVAKMEGIGVRDAAIRIMNAFHLDPTGPPPLAPLPPGRPNPVPTSTTASPPPSRCENTDTTGNPPLTVRLALSGDHPHLSARGLTKGAVDHFGVGYCPKGILRGMIAIPVHDSSGTLVAYAGRRLRPSEVAEEGKYKFPKGFHKELVLYNLHRVPNRERVIVVEGFFSVMKLAELGFTEVVATMGASVSEHQAQLLAAFQEVVMLYDGDDAGRTGAMKAAALLAGRTTVRILGLGDGWEPEDCTPRMLRFLLAGARELDLASIEVQPRTPQPHQGSIDS